MTEREVEILVAYALWEEWLGSFAKGEQPEDGTERFMALYGLTNDKAPLALMYRAFVAAVRKTLEHVERLEAAVQEGVPSD